MQTAARARLFLARRPWVYWLAVAVLAAATGVGVREQLRAVDTARARWADTRTVAVAVHDHEPGDELATRAVELPLVAIPPSAIDRPPPGSRAGQRIDTGEIIVAADVTPPGGPAAGAGVSTVVVAMTDPLARDVRIAARVQVVAEGLVLAAEATVVEVVDEVVYVAVPPDEAPLIAAAARDATASLLYLP